MPGAEQVIARSAKKPQRTCPRVAASFVARAIPGGTLSYLACPERGIQLHRIQLHRIRHDQVDHHHLGQALAVPLVSPAGQASIA
jgi:hypothetical protein